MGGEHVFQLDSEGNLIVCVRNREVVGNAVAKGLSHLINSAEYKQAIERSFFRPEKCDSCPADYPNLGGDRWRLPKDFCSKTLLTYQMVQERTSLSPQSA